MRCLERDPEKRPASALTVAAALPGGDPLAAALAAGETPSPEMLAAAGESQALPVARGLVMVAAVAVGVITVAVLSPRASIPGRVPLDKPPAVLADRAQQIVRSLGYTDRIVDTASDFMSSVGQEYGNFLRIFAVLIFQAVVLWMLYLAIEPFARKFWPDGLLGWTRLLSGRIRDPRIGRELLIGTALGGALMLVDLFRSLSPLLIGRPPGALTLGSEVEVLGGFSRLYGTWADQFYYSLQTALIFVMMLVVARLLLRRTWLAALATVALGVVVAGGGVQPGGIGWLYYVSQLMAIALITFAIFRYGVLVTVVMMSCGPAITCAPIALALDAVASTSVT